MKRSATALVLLVLAMAGCGEKAQTSNAAKKVDGKAWESTQGAYLAEGWKGGDQAGWEAQMRIRVQSQNEYSRSAAAAPATAPTP